MVAETRIPLVFNLNQDAETRILCIGSLKLSGLSKDSEYNIAAHELLYFCYKEAIQV